MNSPDEARAPSPRKSTLVLVPELTFDPGQSNHVGDQDHHQNPLSSIVDANGKTEGCAAYLCDHRNHSSSEATDIKSTCIVLPLDVRVDAAEAPGDSTVRTCERSDNPTSTGMSTLCESAGATALEAQAAPVAALIARVQESSETLQVERANADNVEKRDAPPLGARAPAHGSQLPPTSSKIHVPMRHARAAVLCASTSTSDSVLRNTFWSLLTGEMPSSALVHSFRCIIEPEICGQKNVWVRALDADPLCYLSLIFSRVNVPPITHFSVINASSQPQFIDSLYLRDIGIFIVPFDLDPFLGSTFDDDDALDSSAFIINSLVSLFQRIATLCVRHGTNLDFTGPSVILAGVSAHDLNDSHIPILQLVSDTIIEMLKGSFVSLGIIECALDASSCLWFYPLSSSNLHGLSAIQDALCAFFYGHSNKTFTVPQHWFHLLTCLRQNSQPAISMSDVQGLAAECFALDISSLDFLSELERFISFFEDQGVACRSSTSRNLLIIDGPLLAWQCAAAVLYHDGSIKHPSQQHQSNSRRSHQQAYHAFTTTGQLTSALLKTFVSPEALACHALPMLIACKLIVPLSTSDSPQSSETFAVLPMMPKVNSDSIQLQFTSHSTPCLSLICFMFACDVPAMRVSALHVLPELWAALRATVVDELELGIESIVMSSAVFACMGAAPFYVEHDLQNQLLRLKLYGSARDVLFSRISCSFSRAMTAFPFLSHEFFVESLQFPSCGSLPRALFPLRKLLHAAATDAAFEHHGTTVAAAELCSVLGNSRNSNRGAPCIAACIVYSPASLAFARQVCDELSRSRVAEMDLHCHMVQGAPFTQPNYEIIDAVKRSNHTIVLAEQQELADVLHSQPHSMYLSQLSTLHQIFKQSSGLSFSSFIIDKADSSPCLNVHCDRAHDAIASLISTSTVLPSAAASGIQQSISHIFFGFEQLRMEHCATESLPTVSLAHAVSSSVVLRLLSLLPPRAEDAHVFQSEFSTVTLESDSAFQASSSIELDVSAVSNTNARADASIPHIEFHHATNSNLDVCTSRSNDDENADGFDDEHDSHNRSLHGHDGHDSSVSPRPPTPPEGDEVLQLQALILSLNSLSPAQSLEESAVQEKSSTSPPALQTEIQYLLPIVEQASSQTAAGVAPTKNALKITEVDKNEFHKGTSSSSAKKIFLKKGANSLRQKQRHAELAIALVDPSPKQSTQPVALYADSSSWSSISPIRPLSASKSPHRTRTSSRERQRSVPDPARSLAVAVSKPAPDPYPAHAHPRLTLLLPELCFDRSPGAAHRLVSSWLDEGRMPTTRSKSMRLICLCEMHIARPQGPSSSPMILWHRCSHQGFPVAPSKGRRFCNLAVRTGLGHRFVL